MKPIVINIHSLVENLSVTDSVQGRQELQDKITESLNKVIQSASEIQQDNPDEYRKDLHSSVKSSQDKEKFEGQFPEMIVCSEVYQSFCRLLSEMSRLDQEKQLYGMLLHRNRILEQELYQNEPKPFQVQKPAWHKNFED